MNDWRSCLSSDCWAGASHLILLLLCVRITKRFRWCVEDKTTSFFLSTLLLYFWLLIFVILHSIIYLSCFRCFVFVVSCKSHQNWGTDWGRSRKPTAQKRFYIFCTIQSRMQQKRLHSSVKLNYFLKGAFEYRFLSAKHCSFNSGLIQFQIF